ncbi:MAG: nitroreductase/quinone reductase family protein [Actinomycetota bacterium]|nr:nitroreductase/quinone reductase family protein [Actinomycetota bacterium]
MSLDQATTAQLASTLTVDLTTIGRRSKAPRTIEIWWFHIDDRFIITGTRGERDWLANIRQDPKVVISSPHGAFKGTAIEIHDHSFRRRVFTHPDLRWYTTQEELEALVIGAPMIEIRFTTADDSDPAGTPTA